MGYYLVRHDEHATNATLVIGEQVQDFKHSSGTEGVTIVSENSLSGSSPCRVLVFFY